MLQLILTQGQELWSHVSFTTCYPKEREEATPLLT